MKRIKIINGRIPDFTNGSLRYADILIKDNVIYTVGTVNEDADEVIDAEGQIVSPGFINIHTHESKPNDNFFNAFCELRMGVTTSCAGNCGDEAFPILDFIDSISRKGSPVNYLMFVGQNNLRKDAGATDHYASSTVLQLDHMKKRLSLLRKAASPVGLSCGFEYSPGITAEETIELLDALEDDGYLVSVHMRADGSGSVHSTEELVEISRCSGYDMQMSHIGSMASGYMRENLAIIENARRDGLDMMTDCYPYNAFSCSIGSAVFDDSNIKKREYGSILIVNGPNAGMFCDRELLEYERKNRPNGRAVCFAMDNDEIALALKQPYTMVGSDGGYTDGTGHPRGSGTFPRVLGRLVRMDGSLTLMDALKKMTVMPAERLKLNRKGQIAEGYDADIVIFDPETIIDKAEYELSKCTLPPEGISRVIVSGETAVKNNEIVNSSLGRYIKYK